MKMRTWYKQEQNCIISNCQPGMAKYAEKVCRTFLGVVIERDLEAAMLLLWRERRMVSPRKIRACTVI